MILSQLFYGLGEGLSGIEQVNLSQLISALEKGVKCAYSAVAEPVEGTMLTVAREAIERAKVQCNNETSAAEFFDVYLYEMKSSLERTPARLDLPAPFTPPMMV